MGWFSKTKKFAAAIALIGALSSAACQPDLPKEEVRRISGLSNQIQRQLKKGEVDKARIREFARIVARVDQKYRLRRVHIPGSLVDGIEGLSEFYFNLEQAENDARTFLSPSQPMLLGFDPARVGFLVRDLFAAESELGIRLDEERERTKHYYEALFAYFNRHIEKLRREKAPQPGIDAVRAKIEKVERVLSTLR